MRGKNTDSNARARKGSRTLTRRDLFKLGAGAGAAAAFAGVAGPIRVHAEETPPRMGGETTLPQVPRRVLGKTGRTVPILLFGGAVPLDAKFDPKIAESLRFGGNYIDAADCYNNGKCEAAVGSFIRQADNRKNVWITSKSDRHDPEGLESTLNAGLSAAETDYFDMYYLHALQDPGYVNDDMKQLVARLKREKKINHFGFSCHDGNVAELLDLAARTPWIDSVMFRYNFDQYGNKKLNDAMDACVKSGVGLIAMKTQRSEVSFQDSWQAFQQKGKWNKHQAVLKAVWADERISAAVSHMDTFEKLKENIAAAVDQFDLGRAEYEALEKYAQATRHLACDGCDHICNPAVNAPVQIGASLRFLMYHDVYGETGKARRLYSQLPEAARHLDGVDFSPANRACPFGVDVAAHMQRVQEILA